MKYLIKRKKIDENTIEKLMIPVGDPPPEKEIIPANIKRLNDLKATHPLKEMVGNRERAEIGEEVSTEERKLK